AGGGVYYASLNSPEFCRSCHLMETFYQSWRTGEHREFRCQDCHHPPFSRKLKGVRRWVRERPQTFPPDVNFRFDQRSCVSCHEKRDHAWVRTVRSDDHVLHPLGEKIRCLDCHREGQHRYRAEEGPARCTRCHGPAAREDVTRCEGCHGAAVKMITAEVDFPVPRAASEHIGVDCAACHLPGKGKGRSPHAFSAIPGKEKTGSDFRGCRKCHEDYRTEEFRRFIRTPQEEIARSLRRLREARAESDSGAGGSTGEIDAILKLIEEDGSSGFHNEVLTRFLMARVEERLKKNEEGRR
ncbi:MAG: NapC/NirT family cytochrome c, partial [Nitrospirae bacterium]|nr:NapC/NirT family cytochrome c [Nitrospirota bacterium]